MRRTDPIFGLETPLLFAHRGGAREVPESTLKGFKHAAETAEADVLELDVQMTRDGEFVVWHGPKLDNVRILLQSDKPSERKRTKIYHYDWPELDGKAWVGDPHLLDMPDEEIDLSTVPEDSDRCLMRLKDFMTTFPDHPLNIEMKKSFVRRFNETDRRGLRDNIEAFVAILDRFAGSRPVVVASAVDDHIDTFREVAQGRYPTNLSITEQLMLQLFGKDMRNRALETSYNKLLSGRRIVSKVHESGGSVFVFLTAFGPLLPALDKAEPAPEQIFEILDRGVDGIMTDRPESLRKIIDQWVSAAGGPQ
jgi:glycerophosphoryl diester phosphodiesterase